MFFLKEQSHVEVINDINGDLVNLYRIVKHHLDEFVRQFRWALVSRKMYDWLKQTPEETLTDIQQAARFFYLQKIAFGAKVTGPTFGTATTAAPRLNLLRIEEELSLAHLRLSRTYIENLPWDECIRRYDRPHSLLYLDPPYWGTTGYGMDFGLEQYARIAELGRSIKGKMITSTNDILEMREIFDGFEMERVQISYTVGGNRNKTASSELIIRNW
uniref:site-specific DNA-methyltransferase (adenine-specific) n=1 Tax=Candidatus Kentrum sp. TUN TaxID=2126343 RepID=A0A451AG20_9GAMM|nr:MAG: DNA adenine methylase [Candidatus Kentron sp. TUN]